VRQFEVFDSLEADFRATGVMTRNELADELMLKRVHHGFNYLRINRAGRCLVDWMDALIFEQNWLALYEQVIEDSKRLEREQQEAERKEREAEELRRAAAEEADRERRKSRFMGSFGNIQWID
jgi:hypothetical protein